MKKALRSFLTCLSLCAFFSCIFMLLPNVAYAWEVEEVYLSDFIIENDVIKSFKLYFKVPGDIGNQAVSWVSAQTVPFRTAKETDTDFGDFTNLGRISSLYNFATVDDVKNNSEFMSQYGILAFSPNGEGFNTFGGYEDINVTFTGLNLPTNTDNVIYFNLWTNGTYELYPDALIAKITINEGRIFAEGSEGCYFGNVIAPFTIKTSVSPYIGFYDGEPHQPSIVPVIPSSGCTMEFGTVMGVYDLNVIPTYTAPGEYHTFYRITAEGYETLEGVVDTRIMDTTKQELQLRINAAETNYDDIKDDEPLTAGETLQSVIDDAILVKENENATSEEIKEAMIQVDSAAVIARISVIGDIEPTETCGVRIATAEEEYDSLSAEEKARVTNYNALISARDSYETAKEEDRRLRIAIHRIDAIDVVFHTRLSEELITMARNTYRALPSKLKPLVTNYDVLLAAESEFSRLSELYQAPRFYKANTVSFKDNLNLNFLALIDDYDMDNTYIKFTYNHYGEEKEVIIYANPNDMLGDYYRFRFPLTASELMITVNADLVLDNPNSEPEIMDSYSRSIREYIIAGLNSPKATEAEKMLFKATLNYGGYTQKYFGYNGEPFAYEDDENISIYNDVSDVNIVSEVDFVRPEEALEGLRYYGSSVFFKDAPYIRYYFEPTETINIDDYEFSMDGYVMEPTEKDGRYYIECQPVYAYELDFPQNIVVKKGNTTLFDFNYSIIAWAKIVSEQSNSLDEVNMAKALFVYYQTAKAFVDGNL